MVRGIIESMREDRLLPEDLKPRLRRLGAPLHKLALLDERFLVDPAHPARQLINRLAQLDLEASADGGDAGLVQRVDAAVSRVAGEFDRNPAVFEEVLADLDAIAAERGGLYRNQVRAVVRECEQQQAAARAQRRGAPDTGAPPKEVSREWAVWLNRAKRLRVGDLLLLKRGGQPPARVALAWIGEDSSPFVFVNARGRRAATMTLQELAMQLRRGTAVVLDRSDLAPVDRAVFSTLYRMHDRIGRQALHDPLTGLINRKKFLALLEHKLAECATGELEHALAVLQFGGVEAVTERAGPAAGTSLLKKVARILAGRLGEGATLARVGEREFAVALERTPMARAQALAEELVAVVRKIRVRYKEEQFALSVRIGVVPLQGNTGGVGALLEAGTATAASAGDSAVAVAGSVPAQGAGAGPDWRGWLERTLADQTVTLRCQRIRPVGDPQGGDAYCEVLVGMETEAGVQIMPADVAQSADLAEQVRAFDRMVIRESLKWMERNRDVLDRIGGCAINISTHSMADPELMDYVLGQLTETMVPPGRVCFEITEAAAVANLEDAERFVRTMKEFGCRFVLDGFGSGETAQGYLNSLPVDFLKIDAMFVRDLDSSPNDAAVVRSISEIGRLMSKQTIASDVRDQAVLERLREIGVDFAQGPGIAAPCALDEVA